jgi:hypothetical protein
MTLDPSPHRIGSAPAQPALKSKTKTSVRTEQISGSLAQLMQSNFSSTLSLPRGEQAPERTPSFPDISAAIPGKHENPFCAGRAHSFGLGSTTDIVPIPAKRRRRDARDALLTQLKVNAFAETFNVDGVSSWISYDQYEGLECDDEDSHDGTFYYPATSDSGHNLPQHGFVLKSLQAISCPKPPLRNFPPIWAEVRSHPRLLRWEPVLFYTISPVKKFAKRMTGSKVIKVVSISTKGSLKVTSSVPSALVEIFFIIVVNL